VTAEAVQKQCGALPYRVTLPGVTEVLLVTSRGTGRWIVPKGWPIPGLSDAESAAREAYEEAGVLGAIDEAPFGTFAHWKSAEDGSEPGLFHIDLYPLRVERELTLWPEAHQRRKVWVSIDQAVTMIEPGELRDLVAAFKVSPEGE